MNQPIRVLVVDDSALMRKLIPQMLAVRVAADHLELHIRGLTAEPWGQGRTFLDRGPDGTWRLAE